MQVEVVIFFIVIPLAFGYAYGWSMRNRKAVEEIRAVFRESEAIAERENLLAEKLDEERENDRLKNSQNFRDIDNLKKMASSLEKQKNKVAVENAKLSQELRELKSTYTSSISNLKRECAALPSVVKWAVVVQEYLDNQIVNELRVKDRPALKAAEEVKQSRESARNWRRQAEILRNRISAYEVEVPWIRELDECTVEDIVEGLENEASIRALSFAGDDPAKAFLSASEWSSLSYAEKGQLSLDRYWGHRQKNAWLAGLQYERYIGYCYEKEGYSVNYHGAEKGFNDLGIDLICRKSEKYHLVQCKRLSPNKGVTVRENVVSQIYGASIFFAHTHRIPTTLVTPVVVTSFELSAEAKNFASALGVLIKEWKGLEKYPVIKCNNSSQSGEKIYHLPFDQQYDSKSINFKLGDIYAETVKDAESMGFRRAFRWNGT